MPGAKGAGVSCGTGWPQMCPGPIACLGHSLLDPVGMTLGTGHGGRWTSGLVWLSQPSLCSLVARQYDHSGKNLS